jgi:SAM-dependent methyltransferase
MSSIKSTNVKRSSADHDPLNDYFSGKLLYGDDFTQEEIDKWFQDEQEGYADLGSANDGNYVYPYHAMNMFYGFRYCNFETGNVRALGIGAAYGDEFLPIATKLSSITILEPSSKLVRNKIGTIIPEYLKPRSDGTLPFASADFQLITCFGTLHHIPNVSFVLSELLRVLARDGFLLIREPIRTMGDWREPRPGLTKNERGIPHSFFDTIFERYNARIVRKSFCDSLFLYKLISKLVRVNKNSHWYNRMDAFASRLLSFNVHYHPRSAFDKLSPSSVFYVITKR